MLQLNRVGRPISAMEEALVVHSLCHEDGLSPVEIGVLVGRHKSWVCRRLSLIERLSDEAQQSIRLGLLLKGVLKRVAENYFVKVLTPLKGVLKRVPFIGVRKR